MYPCPDLPSSGMAGRGCAVTCGEREVCGAYVTRSPSASVPNGVALPMVLRGALVAFLKTVPLVKCQQIAYALLPRRETACVPFDDTWNDAPWCCPMTERFPFLCAVAMMLTG